MQNESATGNGFFQILKGVGFALGFSFLAVVILANILRFTPLPEKVVYPVNQTVKVVAIVLGAFLFVRGEKGFLKGGAIALMFTALSYLTFSAIGGNFSLSGWIVIELFLAVFAGVIGGAIAVNVRRGV